jgi:hypothetical protein
MRRRPTPENGLFAISSHLYRALLAFYPRTFRREFGPHMAQVFGDACRQAQGERGAVGIFSLWIWTVSDLAVSALQERLLEGVRMPRLSHWSRSAVVRAGGAAALLGGALYLLSLLTHPQGLLRATVPGSIVCFMLGMVGLHALLWGREGRLGVIGVVLVSIGLLLGLIGMANSAIMCASGCHTPVGSSPSQVGQILNSGEHAGLAFIGAGMLLWGIVAFRARALGRWSVMPLVIGLLSLAGIMFFRPDLFAVVEHSLLPEVFAACWILLGYALVTRRFDASPLPSQSAAR